MNGRIASVVLVSFLVIGGFIGFLNFDSDNTQGMDVSGVVSTDTTWDLTNSPYIVIGDVTVTSGAILTIDAGVQVRFDGFFNIYVDGSIIVNGTETDRINITSNLISPSPGDWDRIEISSLGHAEINYAEISYGSTGIFLEHSQDNNITNSNFLYNMEKGIYLNESSGNKIAGNNASGNNFGIVFRYSNGNLVIANNAVNNSHGFQLYRSDGNNITGNNASNNAIGIQFSAGCDWNNVTNNIFSHNNNRGIWLDWSNYNMISGNIISSNTDEGIRLSSCLENDIIGNTITHNNFYGLYLITSFNIRIYHNSIIDNANQAYDEIKADNQWDNDYPSGGNYWSNYDQPGEGAYDDFQGPNQNIPGGDEIADSPFNFDPDSQDNYPLMNPIGNYTYLYEGWNLISIPRILIETDPGTVLSSISGSYKTIQWYNSTDLNDPWKHNCTTKPQHLNDFDSIDHVVGFWIYITEPGGVTLEYSGPQPGAPQNIPLHTGWNMVGFPSLSNKDRTTALNNLDFGTEVDAIWTHDAATQTWGEVDESDSFFLGKGYWIHATQDCVWNVPL
jgi:parallel beta-helix repeat protein